jgi:stringent starvation protein B
LKLGNDFIEFKARFGGVAREIVVPVDHVVAIYARENGQGMAFPMPSAEGGEGSALAPGNASTVAGPRPVPGLRLASTDTAPAAESVSAPTHVPALAPVVHPGTDGADDDQDPPPSTPNRPTLKRVK